MGSNNYVELRALRLLLIKALEWGVSSIQVFGDSRVILDWALGNSMCNVLCLRPLLEEVKLLSSCFNLITFVHVYRERNQVADGLSKEGAQLPDGEEKKDLFLRDPGGFYHRPFRDGLQLDTVSAGLWDRPFFGAFGIFYIVYISTAVGWMIYSTKFLALNCILFLVSLNFLSFWY